jgi:hypothetical protein
MSGMGAKIERSGATDGWSRWAPWTGVGFVALFIGSVVASSPPSDGASNARWVAAYSTHSDQVEHVATGVLLVLAGLFLMMFLTHLWTRIAEARQPRFTSPLPIVAAGVAATCMAVGGILMGATSGSLLGSAPMPSADFLRFGNDAGFIMVGIPGMIATAISIACLSVQAHSAGIFGKRLMWFSLAVGVVLLASFAFLPIAALLVWLIVVAVSLLRRREVARQVVPAAT